MQYAIIRFCPYPDIGEFINIGIIAFKPKTNDFYFKVAAKPIQRFIGFFPNITDEFYKTAVKCLFDELTAIDDTIKNNQDTAENAFHRLTQPKSNLFQFSQVGAMLTDDPKKSVNKLFYRCVYHEEIG